MRLFDSRKFSSRRGARALIAALCFSLLSFAADVAAAPPRRLQLPNDRGTLLVHGGLNGFADAARFVLHARQNERLALSVLQGACVVMVTYPNKKSDGAPGGDTVILPQTGDYQIVVTEVRMTEPWRGPFTLRVRLSKP